jgi:hypothetical protein
VPCSQAFIKEGALGEKRQGEAWGHNQAEIDFKGQAEHI